MAQKSTRIDDIKRPNKVTPAATSRPILVTNRPVLTNDPMVVPDAAADSADSKPMATAPVMHTARIIKPLDGTLTAAAAEAAAPATETRAKDEPAESKPFEITPPKSVLDAESAETAQTDLAAAAAEPKDAAEASAAAEPAAESDSEPKDVKPDAAAGPASSIETPAKSDGQADTAGRDPEAAVSAEEIAAAEARTARELELEQLVTSGKYRVPINAVQRKRSRANIVLLLLLAVVLAAALLDVILDSGMISLPFNLPHTHFFTGR